MGDSALFVANAVVAALLINSGAAKLVSTTGLRHAMAELAPAMSRFLGAGMSGVVRTAAVVELLAAAGLVVDATRTIAAGVTAFLGICFAILGAAGMLRGSAVACGCFGRTSEKPLGMVNLLIGLALILIAVFNAFQAPAAGHPSVGLAVAALATLLLCLWLNRRLAMSLLRPNVREAGTA